MKGISEIIATILMLMITLGISGTAYIFISGAFTQQTQGLEVVDAYCQDGAPDVVNLIMRNLGTSSIPTSSITVTQSNPTDAPGPSTCATPGQGLAVRYTQTGCEYACQPTVSACDATPDGWCEAGEPSTCADCLNINRCLRKDWGGITAISPGTTATLMDACEGANPRACIYRIVPPAGRSIVASVSCN